MLRGAAPPQFPWPVTIDSEEMGCTSSLLQQNREGTGWALVQDGMGWGGGSTAQILKLDRLSHVASGLTELEKAPCAQINQQLSLPRAILVA